MTFQLLSNFTQGAALIGNAAAFLLGAGLVLILAIMGLLIFAALAGWLFDKVTARISARWLAKGIRPKGRIAQIIYSHAIRDG